MLTLTSPNQTIREAAADEFDNSFEVPLPPAAAWTVLSDIQRIARCVPGVELTDVVDNDTYQGKISVPLGPLALTFALWAKFEAIDPVNRTARLKAQGPDVKDQSGADCTLSFRLEPASPGSGSRVLVHSYVVLSGTAAQFARKEGLVHSTAEKIINQFAANLRNQLTAPPS